MPEDEGLRVTDNTEASRYEIHVGGALAGFATYRLRPDTIVIQHTETLPEFEHRGLASELARQTLDDIRRRGLLVTPRCPYFARYIREHPEYADLVAP